MQNELAIYGAIIGATVLTIFVGLLRRDKKGGIRAGDLLAAVAAGGIMGGMLAYAAVPAPIPLKPAPVEETASVPPEAALEPAMGTPEGNIHRMPPVSAGKKHVASTKKSSQVANGVPPGGAGTCHEYQTSIFIDGKAQPAYGTTCQNEDGSWQRME